MLHWLILPTYICGALIGVDAIRWLKGDYDLFDPKGVLGALGWHGFFLAPLLFINWEVGMKYAPNPPDWRPWVGYLSLLNIAALWLYQKSHESGFRSKSNRREYFWQVNPNLAVSILFVFLGAGALAQAYYFTRMGGLAGVLDLTVVQRQTGVALVTGVGVFEILGGTIPLLFLIALTLWRRQGQKQHASLLEIVLLALSLGVLQFLLGGVKARAVSPSVPVLIGDLTSFCFRSPAGLFGGDPRPGLFMYFYGFAANTRGLDALSRRLQGEPRDLKPRPGAPSKNWLWPTWRGWTRRATSCTGWPATRTTSSAGEIRTGAHFSRISLAGSGRGGRWSPRKSWRAPSFSTGEGLTYRGMRSGTSRRSTGWVGKPS
jgi:hypothetical protein